MLSFKLLPHSFVIPEEEDEETGNETANGERQRFTLTLTQIAGLMIQVLRLLLVVLLLMFAVFPFLLPFSHLMKFQPMDHVCVCACLFFYFRFHELFRSSDPPPPKIRNDDTQKHAAAVTPDREGGVLAHRFTT